MVVATLSLVLLLLMLPLLLLSPLFYFAHSYKKRVFCSVGCFCCCCILFSEKDRRLSCMPLSLSVCKCHAFFHADFHTSFAALSGVNTEVVLLLHTELTGRTVCMPEFTHET